MRFSANLGFLWTDLSLPDAIHAAKAAGFDAVECHWPYDVPPAQTLAALKATGLAMLGINTRRGFPGASENGLSALPDRITDARAAIGEACDYASAIDARAIHVMAGVTDDPLARETFLQNLDYACEMAGDKLILIEPLNQHDAPGYFLQTTAQACEIIEDVGCANLRLMFDCYHVGRTESDVLGRLKAVLPFVGHIQFAAVPDRGPPDHGEVDYAQLFRDIDALGWDGPLGAEYKPIGPTEDSLGWLSPLCGTNSG